MPSAPKRKAARRGKRSKKKTSARKKVQAHRRRLRAQGLRPLQIWVPDTRAPRFAAQARRQARAVAASPHAPEDHAFIAALGELDFE